MVTYNRVILAGNVTKDLEMRRTKSGSAVLDINIAINEDNDAVFVDITVFGKLAETCFKRLKKGSTIIADGRLSLDQWERDGEKRSKLRVRGDRVQFL